MALTYFCTAFIRNHGLRTRAKSMLLLRRLALWVLAAAPSLTTCFVVPPSVLRPLRSVSEGGRLSRARERTHRVATSAAAAAAAKVASQDGQGPPRDDREDARAATRLGFVHAGRRAVVAVSTAVVVAATGSSTGNVSPAIAAEREPEITSKCFIEVSQK